jgi:hypothetical protein
MGMVEKATRPTRYSSGEVYFERSLATNPNLVVKVYTSIPIRVCLVWQAGEQSAGLVKTPKVLRVTSTASVLSRIRQRVLDLNREAVRIQLDVPKCPICGCPVWEDSKRCRNRNCAPPSPTSTAGAARRLASAYGAAHGSMPMTQATASMQAHPVTPVDEATAQRRLATEAVRNVVEEPVLSKADMPPELRGLF